MKTFRTLGYLQSITHFPLAVVMDSGGYSWTWAEGRSIAVAVRGVLPGLPKSVQTWAHGQGQRSAMRLAFKAPRKRYGRVYTREALLAWTGEPWIAPHDPCPHCHGTGERAGTTLGRQRPGRLRSNVVLDRNLLAQLVQTFEPGAITVDAAARPDSRDPLRFRQPDTRGVLARMTTCPDDTPTFEEAEAVGAFGGSFALHNASATPEPEGVHPRDGRPSARRELTEPAGARRTLCGHCGGLVAGGTCEACGKGAR